MTWTIQKSEIDDSVNFIKHSGKSFIECRYVRRQDDQVVVYLSSHNGCNKSCRFCHLTATGQTHMDPVFLGDYIDQALTVLRYWKNNHRTGNEQTVNYNFMARGEPLANDIVLQWEAVSVALRIAAEMEGLKPKFNISTIMPKSLPGLDYQTMSNANIYWSLYSTDEKFRKRWLPKAMEPYKATQILNNFREYGGKVVIHSAFIKDANDKPEDIDNLLKFLHYNDMQDCDFNIVAYNPASPRHGEETDRTQEIFETLKNSLRGRVQIIDRIGPDVKASCGMFVS